MHRGILPGAAHHAHVVHAVLQRPDAALGVEHVATGEHAHIVVGPSRHIRQLVEGTAVQQDALGCGEPLGVQKCLVVVDGNHVEAHMIGQGRHFHRRI